MQMRACMHACPAATPERLAHVRTILQKVQQQLRQRAVRLLPSSLVTVAVDAQAQRVIGDDECSMHGHAHHALPLDYAAIGDEASPEGRASDVGDAGGACQRRQLLPLVQSRRQLWGCSSSSDS